MAFKIRVKSPSLMDLVEVDKNNSYSIYPVPFGKASDLGKIVVKRAVPWKGVKGSAYKSAYKAQYEKQQAGSKKLRDEAVRKYRTEGLGKVALVTYGGSEYGIMPTVSALMAIEAQESGRTRKHDKLISIVNYYPNKEAALAELRKRTITAYEPAISI